MLMVEFFPGSGFYPPTQNSVIGSFSFDESQTTWTHTYSITATDRLKISSMSMYQEQVQHNSVASGTCIVDIRVSNNPIVYYTITLSGGDGIYLNTDLQQVNYTLEKGDTVTMTLTQTLVPSGGGAYARQKGFITIFGEYII